MWAFVEQVCKSRTDIAPNKARHKCDNLPLWPPQRNFTSAHAKPQAMCNNTARVASVQYFAAFAIAGHIGEICTNTAGTQGAYRYAAFL